MIEVSFIEMGILLLDSEKLIKGFTLSNGASQELILPPLQCKQPYLATSCQDAKSSVEPEWNELRICSYTK
jgi:hypothetical protein